MHRDDFNIEESYNEVYTEAYTGQLPTFTPVQKQPVVANTPTLPAQNNQEQVKKDTNSVKDWVRLPFIDTPFKARMAAVLIVELIYNMTKDVGLRDLVLKEIRTNNRLNRR